jgi:nucleotide-binding universal stress UspA family protein
MSNVKKILFPTDFSETAQNAFAHCLLLAREMRASIVLLHAVYPEYEALDLPVVAAKATQDKVEAGRVALQSFRDLALGVLREHHDVQNLPSVELHTEIGGPVGVIVEVAEREEVDLIIMGTQGEHSALERVFGSVTTEVVERVQCPVLVIPEERPYQRFKVVAYASDLNESDPAHFWQAIRLLEPFSPVVHVVHIDTGDRRNGEIDFSDMREFFTERAPALQVDYREVRGESVEEGLEQFVDSHSVDLLIMFAPQRGLLSRIFRRSRTRRMALRSHVPLLLIKE